MDFLTQRKPQDTQASLVHGPAQTPKQLTVGFFWAPIGSYPNNQH